MTTRRMYPPQALPSGSRQKLGRTHTICAALDESQQLDDYDPEKAARAAGDVAIDQQAGQL